MGMVDGNVVLADMPDNQEKDEEENEEGDSPESLSENEYNNLISRLYHLKQINDQIYFSYA